MGIRFVCHHCGFAMHVKNFLAGKRGKCPQCTGSFRIPASDSSYSSPLEDGSGNRAVAQLKLAFQELGKPKDIQPEKVSSESISLNTETTHVAETSHSAVAVSEQILPAILADSKDAKWFVRPPSGGQFGPAPSQMLMTWIQESRVTADSFLWREGMTEWQLAKELVPDLFSHHFNDTNSVGSSHFESPTDLLSPSPDLSEMTETLASPSVIAMKKRQRQRRQQQTLIILLSTVSLILLGALIYVLAFQGPVSPAPISPSKP